MPDEEIKYLDLAFLCDGATERGGSLSALGIGVNLVMAQRLPTMHTLTVVIRLAWKSDALPGFRDLHIRFLAPSGKEIAGIEGQFAVETTPNEHPELGATGAMVWPVPLVLEEAGVYEVEISIEGVTYPPLLFKVLTPA